MVVYVTEQGAVVGLRRNRLLVQKAGETLQHVRLLGLEQLLLFGKVQVSTQALRALLQNGTDTVLLTVSGRFLGRLSNGMSGNIGLRRLQFEQLACPEVTLELAKRYVEGKLRNCLTLIRRHNRTLRSDAVARNAATIRRVIDELASAATLDQLRGLEGTGSASHFAALRHLFRAPGIAFFRRERRPPPDPVNILLSLGYTLLGNLVHAMLETAGLDPYLGALHEPRRGRPSLALDLIEEFRPVLVDVTAIRAVNTRAITADDFYRATDEDLSGEEALWRDAADSPDDDDHDEKPNEDLPPPPRQVLITSAGLKKWFLAFERRLEETVYHDGTASRLSYRRLLREQVYRLARHLRGEDDYRPHLLRS